MSNVKPRCGFFLVIVVVSVGWKMEEEILDVLVVGAGVSALTAAYEIQKAHSNVKLNLIEAKSELTFRSLIPYILS